MDPTTALETTRAWPMDDRVEFAIQLWNDLLDSGWVPEPDDELAAELDRRLDAHEADPTQVRTSEQVWERLRSKR
jgi:putative addiction module component (TIGR02574 family)